MARGSLIKAEVDVRIPADIDWRQFNGYVETQIDAIAAEVRDEAKASTSFADRTGLLRKSIKIRKQKDANGDSVTVVAATAPHAHLVEFGTQGPRKSSKALHMYLDGLYGPGGGLAFAKVVRAMPARPFLRPALAKVMARRMAGFAAGGAAHADFGHSATFGWEG